MIGTDCLDFQVINNQRFIEMKKLLLLLFLINLSVAQNYIWPTNSSDKLSATFGEYRPGHFHAGIDIKTNNTNGYPCFAISDGYVSRLLMSPTGYGKAIYLTLDDGNTAVYGHLSGFPAKIDSLIKKEQKAADRYSIIKYFQPGELPVKKGETIAYTGDTGTRYPHLHFEIRDSSQNPVNPLQFDGLDMDDNTPPVIQKIAIVPASSTALINGLPDYFVTSTSLVQTGKYRINKAINVKGSFGIEIATHDIVKGLWNKYGPAKIDLYLNDSLYFSQVTDTFSYDNSNMILFDRDFQLISEGRGQFIRMWKVNESIVIPFHKTGSNGIIQAGQEKIDARLEVYDFKDNKSEVTLTFVTERMEVPKVLSFSSDSLLYNFILQRDSLSHIYQAINLSWISAAGVFIEQAPFTRFTRTDSTYEFSIEKQRGPALKIAALSPITGAELVSYFNPQTDGRENSAEITFQQKARTFVAQINFLLAPRFEPQLVLHFHDRFQEIELLGISPKKFLTAENSLKKWCSAHTLEIKDGSGTVTRLANPLFPIYPGHAANLNTESFALVIPEDFVFDTLLVNWRIDTNFLHPKYHLKSNLVHIMPDNQVLISHALLTMKYDKKLHKAEKLGIYSIGPENAGFLSGEIDTAAGRISALIKNLGSFALLLDDTPPTITNIYPVDGKYYKRSSIKAIQATIDDRLSKIAGEDHIEMKLDGNRVIAEWHPIHKTLKYVPEEKLSAGSHWITITLADHAGNTITRETRFHILD
ncbi:MAG: M23 family metallopeptidase [Candidatus Marinimicrobia bacterium]|nr:M23 family metallopeptidase [Candidatus Neomarinimicrobiota bacterium]